MRSFYDNGVIANTRHWYITWRPDMPHWALSLKRGMLFLGALGVTYYR